jgi:formate dehydrogenase subunit delta
MHIENLVKMANQISAFYDSESPGKEAAAESVFSHIRRFWEPRMRSSIIEHWKTGGEGLRDSAKDAVGMLAKAAAAA